jgi:hypothetical protein
MQGERQKCAHAINRDERAEQKTRIDKLSLGDGSVYHFQRPAQKAINCKKRYEMKKTHFIHNLISYHNCVPLQRTSDAFPCVLILYY